MRHSIDATLANDQLQISELRPLATRAQLSDVVGDCIVNLALLTIWRSCRLVDVADHGEWLWFTEFLGVLLVPMESSCACGHCSVTEELVGVSYLRIGGARHIAGMVLLENWPCS